jgi:hypothetical protein
MSHEEQKIEERRKYIRLDTVFPVQFRLVSLDGRSFLSGWLLGFTSDVSHGGICLSANALDEKCVQLVRNKSAKVALEIEMPLLRGPAVARANIAWVKDSPGNPTRYLIGLTYEDIDQGQNSTIMRYAWTRKLFVPAVIALFLLLGSGFMINSFITARLIKSNKALVEQLIEISQEASAAKERSGQVARERQDLEESLRSLQSRIQGAQEDRPLIDKLTQDKSGLQEQLSALQRKESAIADELQRLGKERGELEKINFDKMYRWLSVHQNPRTGLVMSFEGAGDIKNWAFTYDQSLVAQVYNNASDYGRARKVLEFFSRSAERSGGLFYNAYYANDGSPAEYTVHCGPNIWLGIAILHYIKESRDSGYLYLAEEIAQSIMTFQDKEGGIRGGPDTTWYATEHNQDAYAFFNMLYSMTNKRVYRLVAENVLDWLRQHTYDQSDIPIQRGKGDSTIATDTYAWSIAAIGPAKLREIGMNPDKIMEFAEANCVAEVTYIRPDGRSVRIKGFDFAPEKHLGRGGVVSSEWTAQMIVSFKIMSAYYKAKGDSLKALSYSVKANDYIDELEKMIISSPSASGEGAGCLPYATQDSVDTGHGWNTPKGTSTGSVAGTAYAIFAFHNYNPLVLED